MDYAVMPLVAMAIALLLYAVALGEVGKAERRTRALRDQEAARMRGLRELIEAARACKVVDLADYRARRIVKKGRRLGDSPEETNPTVMN